VNSRGNRFVKFNSTSMALLATVLIVSGGASAKVHKAKESENEARVVAHIPFAGLSAVDMAMQKKGSNKYYLYVQHSQDQGISIVDISKPADSRIIKVIPWPDPALSSKMNVTGNFAIIAETGVAPVGNSSPNDDLVVWDLSNPAAPRVVQKFSGVVKWLQDERNFVYVLNSDELWVVSRPEERQPEPTWPAIAGEE
jgi:LVIVD repeat